MSCVPGFRGLLPMSTFLVSLFNKDWEEGRVGGPGHPRDVIHKSKIWCPCDSKKDRDLGQDHLMAK